MEHRKFDPKDYAAKARQTVAEGAVLLRNEKKTLPFSQGTKVAVFGRSQFNYYKKRYRLRGPGKYRPGARHSGGAGSRRKRCAGSGAEGCLSRPGCQDHRYCAY